MTTSPKVSTQHDDPSTRVTAHMPLVIATAGALYFGLKLLILAGGDLQTAMAMATRLEFLPTVAAMTINVAPLVLLPFIYAVTPGLLLGAPGSNLRIISAVMYSLLFVLGGLFSAPGVLLIFLGYWLAKKLVAFTKEKGWKFLNIDLHPSHMVPGYSALLVSAIFFSPASWIAPEALTLKNAGPIQAYVVSSDERDTVYLRGDTKSLVRTKSELIEKQEFCSLKKIDILSSPVFRLVAGAGSYPDCPKAA